MIFVLGFLNTGLNIDLMTWSCENNLPVGEKEHLLIVKKTIKRM